MSWSIEEHIGEGRPWPEQVVVYRGETDESLTYARRSLSDVNQMVELMDTLAADNAKLRELVAKYSAAAKYLCGFSHCNECNLDCASVFGDVPSGWDCARMLLDKKARELGLEVTS